MMSDEVQATWELREMVALGARVLGANGHSDLVWGHLSARDQEGRGVWIKGNSRGFEEIEAADVILVDADGTTLVKGERVGRHAEYPIHTEIMLARDDVGAVVHSHPEHCVALAATGQPLLPISHAANLFVPPQVPRFDETADLITTRDLGRAVARALGDQNAIFLVNHGIVTTGATVADAVVRAVILERACYQQMLTHNLGGWPRWSQPDESLSKRRNIYPPEHLQQVWDFLVRQLESAGGLPGARSAV